jgi:hypothetical protein
MDWLGASSSAMHQSPRRSTDGCRLFLLLFRLWFFEASSSLDSMAYILYMHPTRKKKEQKKVSGSIPHASRVSLYFLVLKTKLYILQHFLQHAQFAGCTLSTYSHALVLVLTVLVRTVHCTWYCCALYPLYPLYRMNRLSWINWVESIWLTRINWIMLVHQSNHSNQLNHVSPPIKTSAVLKAWMSSANRIESS